MRCLTSTYLMIITSFFLWMIVCSSLRVVAPHTHPSVVGPNLEELSEKSVEDGDVECNGEHKRDDIDTRQDKQEVYLSDFSIENLFF